MDKVDYKLLIAGHRSSVLVSEATPERNCGSCHVSRVFRKSSIFGPAPKMAPMTHDIITQDEETNGQEQTEQYKLTKKAVDGATHLA